MDNAFGRLRGRYVYHILLVATLTLASGCSQDDLGPTGTVSGTLLYQGNACAPSTMVIFKDLTSGHACIGETDAQGNYTLDSWNSGNLPVGTYTVMIQPPELLDPETIDPEVLMEHPELMDGGELEYDFPEKYGQVATSGLTFDVQEGANEYDIELVD